MKIERAKEKTFEPIIITLETEEEAKALANAYWGYSPKFATGNREHGFKEILPFNTTPMLVQITTELERLLKKN